MFLFSPGFVFFFFKARLFLNKQSLNSVMPLVGLAINKHEAPTCRQKTTPLNLLCTYTKVTKDLPKIITSGQKLLKKRQSNDKILKPLNYVHVLTYLRTAEEVDPTKMPFPRPI